MAKKTKVPCVRCVKKFNYSELIIVGWLSQICAGCFFKGLTDEQKAALKIEVVAEAERLEKEEMLMAVKNRTHDVAIDARAEKAIREVAQAANNYHESV